MTKAVLKDAGDIVRYVTGGNATFTLKSLKTGTRYTYRVTEAPRRIAKTDHGRSFFVGFLTGSDNENDYQYLGMMVPGDDDMSFKFIHTAKSPTGKHMPFVVFSWFVRSLNSGDLHELLEFWHSGKCSRCGRLLTTPESVARGIGPVCMSKSI